MFRGGEGESAKADPCRVRARCRFRRPVLPGSIPDAAGGSGMSPDHTGFRRIRMRSQPRDVLVHVRAGLPDAHACINSSRARRTASAIASGDTAPRHSSTIVSHAIPRATWPRTSATRMRVPRKVGLPPQMAGSATTYRPRASGSLARRPAVLRNRDARFGCMQLMFSKDAREPETGHQPSGAGQSRNAERTGTAGPPCGAKGTLNRARGPRRI